MNLSQYYDAARTALGKMDTNEQKNIFNQYLIDNPSAPDAPGNDTFLTWFYLEYVHFKADLKFNFLSMVHPVRDITISGFRYIDKQWVECPEKEAEIFRLYAVQPNGDKHDFATSNNAMSLYRLKLLILEIVRKWEIRLFKGFIDSFNYKTICNHDLELVTIEMPEKDSPIKFERQQIKANAPIGEFAQEIEVFNDEEYKLYLAMKEANL